MPTPERIAKGDLEFLQNKTFRSTYATEIDGWFEGGLLGNPPQSTYRREAFIHLYNLSVATSMFNADVIEFSPLGHGSALNDDESLATVQAAVVWKF